MSWDLYLHKYKTYPEITPPKPENKIPLGSVRDVRDAISQQIPVEWSEHFWGAHQSEEAVLEFDVGSMDFDLNEIIDTATIQVRGGTNPLAIILEICKSNHWALFDTATGKYLDQTFASTEGKDIADKANKLQLKTYWTNIFSFSLNPIAKSQTERHV